MTAPALPGQFLPGVTRPTVPVLAVPNFDPGRGRIDIDVPAGLTVLEIVRLALPSLTEAEYELVRVVLLRPVTELQGRPWAVLRERWHAVRPTERSRVVIRVIPEKGALGQILAVVATIGGLALGQWYVAALAANAGFGAVPGLLFGSARLTQAAFAIAGTVAGAFLAQAFVPQTSNKKQSPTYSIDGWKNAFQPGMVLPTLLGEHRQAPVHCAMPYSEVKDGQQYAVALLTLGPGPHEFTIDDIKIGATPIKKLMRATAALDDADEDYNGDSGIEFELRKGLPSDRAITLYDGQRYEERFDVYLLLITDGINEDGFPEEPATKVTASDITKFKLFFFFPALVKLDDDGDAHPRSVFIQVRYRVLTPTDDAAWTTVAHEFRKKSQKPFYEELEFEPAGDRGPAYEVEVTRTVEESDRTNIQNACHWVGLQSIRPEYPLNSPVPLGLIALRVRATKLVNGIVDELTVLNRRIAPTWNGSAWVLEATRSPAAAARYIMQGRPTLSPLTNAEISLESLQELSEFCELRELNYDFIHDAEGSWWEALTQACAAGRAFPLDTGEEWRVIIDKPRTKPIDHLTPLETWGFRWEAPTPRLPHALRATFPNRDNNYEKAIREVRNPDFTGTPTRFEELALPGVTDPRQIYIALYRRWLEIEHRLDRYYCEEGVKNLVLTRGDMALYSHDILMPGTVHGWVREVDEDSRQVVLSVKVHMDAGESYAALFRYPKSNDDIVVSMLRGVATVEGDTNVIKLAAAGPLPPVGASMTFGPSGRETIEVIVKSIESGDDFTARLELMDHAPQIDEELDLITVPDWDARIGDIVDVTNRIPAVPVIRDIVSGLDADTEDPDIVQVFLQSGAGSSKVTTFQVRHRLSGDVTWIEEPAVSASVAVVLVDDYEAEDDIEVSARASNAAGTSAWSDPPEEHTVGQADGTLPVLTGFTAERPNLWRFTWTATDPDGILEGVMVKYAINTGVPWGSLTPLFVNPITNSPWDASVPEDVVDYTFGAVAIVDGVEVGTPIVIDVPA